MIKAGSQTIIAGPQAVGQAEQSRTHYVWEGEVEDDQWTT